MPMLQNRQRRRDYLENRIREHARDANIPIDDLSWYEPRDKDDSVLTVTSRDKKAQRCTFNPDLELKPESYLDDLAEGIVSELNQ